MNSDLLGKKSIRFHVAHLSAKDFYSRGYAWSLRSPATNSSETVLRFLRGERMRTAEALFDEFAAALQFPYYFGRNWAALDECLADLEWVPGQRYILMFTQAEAICKDENLPEFSTLLKILSKVSAEWATPIAQQGALDRSAKQFHSVFQCGDSHLIEERFSEANLQFDIIV